MEIETVGSFSVGNLRVGWLNAILSCGYVVITCNTFDDFVSAWELGTRIQEFFVTNEAIKAEAVGLHFVDFPNASLRLFVLPRYTNDFEDSNLLYDQLEGVIQSRVSTSEKILPLLSELKVFLQIETE
jgi:hypothetical protein